MDIVTFADGGVRILDQTRLPHETAHVTCRTAEEVAKAITEMRVRGAPAIGVAAAYGMALSKDLKGLAAALSRL